MWNKEPWDNDMAADWFGYLMDKTDMPNIVRKTLRLAQNNDFDEEYTASLRAAAYCILQFGRIYVWPIKDLKNDLQLAIQALKKVLLDEDYCYSNDMVIQVQKEIEEMENRVNRLN